MRCCLCKRIEKLQKEFLEKWKSENNIKRFLKKEKEIALEHFEQLYEIKQLRKIYKELGFKNPKSQEVEIVGTTDGGVMLSVFGQNFVYEYNVE